MKENNLIIMLDEESEYYLQTGIITEVDNDYGDITYIIKFADKNTIKISDYNLYAKRIICE